MSGCVAVRIQGKDDVGIRSRRKEAEEGRDDYLAPGLNEKQCTQQTVVSRNMPRNLSSHTLKSNSL